MAKKPNSLREIGGFINSEDANQMASDYQATEHFNNTGKIRSGIFGKDILMKLLSCDAVHGLKYYFAMKSIGEEEKERFSEKTGIPVDQLSKLRPDIFIVPLDKDGNEILSWASEKLNKDKNGCLPFMFIAPASDPQSTVADMSEPWWP